MDDLQLYIYLALAIIYFIARALKPAKKAKPPVGRQTMEEEESAPSAPSGERPLSFEELLKEFTGQKQSKPSPRQEEKSEKETVEVAMTDNEYRTYDEYDDYKTGEYAQYEQQYKPARELKTIDEQVSLEEPIEKAFEEYEIQQEGLIRAKKYRDLLTSQDTLKDAIILREILQPKYF